MSLGRCLFVAGLVAGFAGAQSGSVGTWLQTQYPQLRSASTKVVVEQATLAGVVRTPQQVAQLKAQLRAMQGKQRTDRPAWLDPVDAPATGNLPVVSLDNAFEHETNDGWMWADDMQGQVASGDCSTLNDVDDWKFVATQDGYYTFEVTAAGASPIADSWLVVRNHKGDPIATDDNGAGNLSRIHVYLPAGTYYLEVSGYLGTGGGTYDLVATRDAATVHSLAGGAGSGTTQLPASSATHDVFSFTIPDSRIDLQVASSGDTALVVQRADGVVVFSNRDSQIGGLNAAADIDLPAGQYYAYVAQELGGSGLSFTVTFSATPVSFGDLPTDVSAVGDLRGPESMRLAKIVLTEPTHVDMVTNDGFVNPVLDTNLALLDRDLDYLLDVEDDNPFGPSGFYSRIAMSLPAGTYWAAVTPWVTASGSYTLSCLTSDYAPTGTAVLGDMTTVIPGFGDVGTYLVDNCSPSSVQVRGTDFYFGIMGPDGELASCTRCGTLQPQAGELPRGTSTVFVWDRFDYSAAMTTSVIPPLHLAADGVTVTTRAKEGDETWMFANFTGLTAGLNFGAGDLGFFCLPTDSLLLTVGNRVAPASGLSSWFTLPIGITGVQLQVGDLHNNVTWTGPGWASWRNVFEF